MSVGTRRGVDHHARGLLSVSAVKHLLAGVGACFGVEQEIVARSQYRGTLKRCMFLFDTDASAAAGQEVFHSADREQPAGMVVNAAPRLSGQGSSALVEVKLAALSTGSLHLGTPDGPSLKRGALPYDVPADAVASG